jgi:dTDP-4-dehydrorhamnose 3,5-epimerase
VEKDVTTKIAARTANRAADETLGAKPDRQSVTADWQPLQQLIDGVVVKEVKNVIKDNGYLTEIWRDDWKLAPAHVGQVFQALIEGGGISAWHVHRVATDRLFANHGTVKIVLYDARPDSPTHGRINVLRCGSVRPSLVVVPPGVWHGVQNLGSTPALLLNLPDRAYQYDAPDHLRLPPETDRIPYSFAAGPRPNSDDPGRL